MLKKWVAITAGTVTTLIQNKCIFIENLTLMLLEKNSCTHHGYMFLFSKHCFPRVVEYDKAYHTKICFHKELFRFKYACFFFLKRSYISIRKSDKFEFI